MFERVHGGVKLQDHLHHQEEDQIFSELARDKKTYGTGTAGSGGGLGRPVTVHFLDDTQHVFGIEVSALESTFICLNNSLSLSLVLSRNGPRVRTCWQLFSNTWSSRNRTTLASSSRSSTAGT